MPPALPVVRVESDARNVGKTWLASALIEEFTRRGFVVGAVKHSHHPLPIDKPGSDTDLFARAGAARVVFAASTGMLERAAPAHSLNAALDGLRGEVDLAVVEGFKSAELGARLHLDAAGCGTLTSMDGRMLLTAARDDVVAFADAIASTFELATGGGETLSRLVRRAAALHGHHCPGVTLGVRMAMAAARALELPLPAAHQRLDVTIETARCAADAIGAATGCSLGQGNLRVDERGEMAARFRDTHTGHEVRVAALRESKALAALSAPECGSARHSQSIAYRVMPDDMLLDVTPLPPFQPHASAAMEAHLPAGSSASADGQRCSTRG